MSDGMGIYDRTVHCVCVCQSTLFEDKISSSPSPLSVQKALKLPSRLTQRASVRGRLALSPAVEYISLEVLR